MATESNKCIDCCSSAKRFGLEGGETLIPGMKMLIDRGADLGVENVVIGMPHRGECGVRVLKPKVARVTTIRVGVEHHMP